MEWNVWFTVEKIQWTIWERVGNVEKRNGKMECQIRYQKRRKAQNSKKKIHFSQKVFRKKKKVRKCRQKQKIWNQKKDHQVKGPQAKSPQLKGPQVKSPQVEEENHQLLEQNMSKLRKDPRKVVVWKKKAVRWSKAGPSPRARSDYTENYFFERRIIRGLIYNLLSPRN